MRNLDDTLNGDLNDSISAYTTGSVTSLLPTSSINENETSYDLIPVVLNQPPIITVNISDASRPKIKSSNTANASGKNLYQFPDGTVKVLQDVTFELRIGAIQPNTLNVENGIPVIKQGTEELSYVWRQDGFVILSDEKASLQSKIIVTKNVIRFERIQPSSAGSYTCEISNDVGTVISEPINLEVLNPDLDAFFYKNLIVNGNATDQINGWDGDVDILIAKEMTKTDTVELKTPNRVDLFGYNVDMMHPRPYQLEVGVVKGLNYEQDFVNKNGGGGYFSRDVYKFDKAGGSFYVKAYQDIDVTPIQDIIKGSVYGMDGVRAIFGCYIGNAISQYIPTKSTVLPDQKTNPKNYFLGAPRISLENFLMAGPGFIVDRCYVTVEEYDVESRLISTVLRSDGSSYGEPNTITLMDPWTKAISKYIGEKYYKTDIHKLGVTSLGNRYDATLFAADDLYPNINNRPTHGQYLEFNRLVLERLNPKTTKIRIGLNFYTNDWRIFDNGDYNNTNSDRIFETIGWEKNFKKATFEQKGTDIAEIDFIRSIVAKDENYKDKPLEQQVPLAPPPRVAITGLSLSLIPIQRQKVTATKYYTSATFNTNSRPQVSVPTALLDAGVFDPKGVLNQNMFVYFQHNSNPKIEFVNNTIFQTNTTSIVLKTQKSGEKTTPLRFTAVSGSVFPFVSNDKVLAYGLNLLNFESTMATIETNTKPYRDIVYANPSGSRPENAALLTASLATAVRAIKGPIATLKSDFLPPNDSVNNKFALWNEKFRYVLHYLVRESGSIYNAPPAPGSVLGSLNSTPKIESTATNTPSLYYLLVDFKSDKPVVLYKDSSLPGGPAEDTYEFIVENYGINAYGEFEFDLPNSMLTTPISKGGLGIPLITNYTTEVSALDSLTFLKDTAKYPSASLSKNIDNLATSYMATQDNLTLADQGVIKTRFQMDIRTYLSGASNLVSLANLKSNYQIDVLKTLIETGLSLPDPKYSTTLYAVSMAPQIGNIMIGSPFRGKDIDGVTYTLGYPRITDSQTAL